MRAQPGPEDDSAREIPEPSGFLCTMGIEAALRISSENQLSTESETLSIQVA